MPRTVRRWRPFARPARSRARRGPFATKLAAGQRERRHDRADEADAATSRQRVQAGHERVLRGDRARGSDPPGRSRPPPSPGPARAGAGPQRQPNAPSARWAAYTEENSEPTTATPSVPPSSRVASLTAEPTPARAGGSTSRIDSVAGVEIRPMPRPISTICGTITVAYDASTATVEIHRNAAPNSTSPVVTTTLVPIRGASSAPTTEATAMLSATGRIRAPVESGAVAADELEVLRDQEDEAEQREERDRHRAAGGAEAPVAEQGDVEHRVRRPGARTDDEDQRAGALSAKPPRVVRRGPAVLGRLDDRVGQRAEHRDREPEAGQVERGHRGSRDSGTSAKAAPAGDQRERDQRPEDAAPVEVLEQQRRR